MGSSGANSHTYITLTEVPVLDINYLNQQVYNGGLVGLSPC